jgi:hypothetical protein
MPLIQYLIDPPLSTFLILGPITESRLHVMTITITMYDTIYELTLYALRLHIGLKLNVLLV